MYVSGKYGGACVCALFHFDLVSSQAERKTGLSFVGILIRDLRRPKFQTRTHTASHRLGPHPHRTSLFCGAPHLQRNLIFKVRTTPHILPI